MFTPQDNTTETKHKTKGFELGFSTQKITWVEMHKMVIKQVKLKSKILSQK